MTGLISVCLMVWITIMTFVTALVADFISNNGMSFWHFKIAISIIVISSTCAIGFHFIGKINQRDRDYDFQMY